MHLSIEALHKEVGLVYFTKMYVMVYKGKGMSVNNRLIGDSCYMYKDEFKEGDKIVVKSYREYRTCL